MARKRAKGDAHGGAIARSGATQGHPPPPPTQDPGSGSAKPQDHWTYAVPALLVGVSTACYINTLQGEFVFDDQEAIMNNKDVTGENNITSLWSHNYWGDTLGDNTARHASFRPLTTLSFRLNCALHGLDVWGYHVTNIALNAVATVGYEQLCYRLLRETRPSALSADQYRLTSLGAALLWTTHPVHTEAVAGLVARADILAAICFQCALLVYMSGCRTAPLATSLATLVLALCAMLCKETGVMVISVCVVYDIRIVCARSPLALLRELGSPALTRGRHEVLCGFARRQAVLWTGSLLMVAARVRWTRSEHVVMDEMTNPSLYMPSLGGRAMTKAWYNTLHAWLLVWPASLSADWSCTSIPLIQDPLDTRNLGSLAALILLLGLSAYGCLELSDGKAGRADSSQDGGRQLVCIALAIMLLPFLPAAHVLLDVGFTVAERLLYMPSQGFCLLIAFALRALLSRLAGKDIGKVAWSVVVVAVTCAYMRRTLLRNEDWRSERSLYESGLETLDNCKMHFNYAASLELSEQTEPKMKMHYERAIELYPKYTEAYNNLGMIHSLGGRHEQALKTYLQGMQGRDVLNVDSNVKGLLMVNIAHAHRSLDHLDEALRWYRNVTHYYAPAARYISMLEAIKRGQDPKGRGESAAEPMVDAQTRRERRKLRAARRKHREMGNEQQRQAPPVQTTAERRNVCTWQLNVDYDGAAGSAGASAGGHLGCWKRVASAEDCCDMCEENPDCAVFTYTKDPKSRRHQMCCMKDQRVVVVSSNDECCDSGAPKSKAKSTEGVIGNVESTGESTGGSTADAAL